MPRSEYTICPDCHWPHPSSFSHTPTEELAQELEKFSLACSNFSKGEWSLEMPQQIGQFPTRTMDGLEGPYITVYKHPKGHYESAQGWGAYWWTQPMPKMPGCRR